MRDLTLKEAYKLRDLLTDYIIETERKKKGLPPLKKVN